jgi:hypothetical protein
VQEVLDNTRGLVSDWSKVFALCPASFPSHAVKAMRQRSRCFSSIPEGHFANFFWLTICKASVTFMQPNSCLFQPVGFQTPLEDFANVVVVISGFGDGVRRGIDHAVRLLGGVCASFPTSAFDF